MTEQIIAHLTPVVGLAPRGMVLAAGVRMLTKIAAGALCLLMMGYGLPRMAVAQGKGVETAKEREPKRGTSKEATEYAQLEKAAPELEEFVGGEVLPPLFHVLFLVALAVGAVYLVSSSIYWLFPGEWPDLSAEEAAYPEAY